MADESPSPHSGHAQPGSQWPVPAEQPKGSIDPTSDLPLRQSVGFADTPATRASSLRRPSIQFVPPVKLESVANKGHSRNWSGDAAQTRRLSSPPPPTKFQPRVSFDTFDNKDAPDYSLTLNRKHRDYQYKRVSRTFMCGTDANDYSDTALEWMFDELVDDNDEVVCLRVIERDSKDSKDRAILNSVGEAREKAYRIEAQRMLEHIQSKNTDNRAINLILEFAIGKVQETIQSMIRVYEPAMLIVGTRGRSLSGFQGLMPGSVSKYCLQYSPIPVIVVRPSAKRDKKKRKRLRDPARRGYRDILDRSGDGEDGGHLLDERNRRSILSVQALSELGKSDADEEARRVAEAIGYRPDQLEGSADNAPLQRVISGRSQTSGRSNRSGSIASLGSEKTTDSNMDKGMPSPGIGKLMKSPDLPDLDSEGGAESSESSDEEEEEVSYAMLKDAKEEALAKAHERAIKTAQEEVEERQRAENLRPSSGAAGRRSRSNTADSSDYQQGATGALALLDSLKAEGVAKKSAERRKKRLSR